MLLTKVFFLSIFLLFVSILYFFVFEVFYFRKKLPNKDFVDFFRYMSILDMVSVFAIILVGWEIDSFALINFICAFLIAFTSYLYEKNRFELFQQMKLNKDIQELISFFEEI